MQFAKIDIVCTETSLSAGMDVSESKIEAVRSKRPAMQPYEAVCTMNSKGLRGPLQRKIIVRGKDPRCRLARLTISYQPRNEVPMLNKLSVVENLLRFFPQTFIQNGGT